MGGQTKWEIKMVSPKLRVACHQASGMKRTWPGARVQSMEDGDWEKRVKLEDESQEADVMDGWKGGGESGGVRNHRLWPWRV